MNIDTIIIVEGVLIEGDPQLTFQSSPDGQEFANDHDDLIYFNVL
ncbi:hypothetical protein [Lentibacillus jeotgali]|nr:hypothetical protein [Lentibacillus jeotgali]